MGNVEVTCGIYWFVTLLICMMSIVTYSVHIIKMKAGHPVIKVVPHIRPWTILL